MYTDFLVIIAQSFDTHMHAKKEEQDTIFVFHSSIKLTVYLIVRSTPIRRI